MAGVNFIVFPLVGAAIGAVTNQIAIRMLFRPYHAIHIGRWRLPFTPGVIPSQRDAIARNIARTFETNLLSGADIHALITGETAKQALADRVEEMFRRLGPFSAMLSGLKASIVDRLLGAIEDTATEALADGGNLDISQRIEERINAMDVARLEQLILGFSTRQFRHITMFGGVLGALIGLTQALIVLLIQ